MRALKLAFSDVAPGSTFDLTLESGDAIPIEERAASEVVTTPGEDAFSPAFDVTPTELITGIVTDRGVLRVPYGESIRKLLG